MQKITVEAIQELASIGDTPKVTLYVPLEATASPPHITENQIRLKNLIHSAVEQLKSRNDTSGLGAELCGFLEKTSDDLAFWRDKSRGLLLAAAPGRMELFDLPIDTEEYAAVDDTFHLAPVLALLGDARQYLVLALAQQNPKLYKGDMYGLTEVNAGLPADLKSALGIDELNQETENQGSATGSSLQTGWFNGRGGAHDLQGADRARFFRLLDDRIRSYTHDGLPMIVAGTDAEIAEYRSLSKYPHLMRGIICGNHTETRSEELFNKASAIVSDELVQPAHAAAREEYERLQGANPSRVSRDEDSISEAAEQGRIDKLLAMMSRHTTDTVQDKVEAVSLISFPEENHSRMLNKLALKVWQASGTVVSLLPHEMPSGARMAARMRY
jgi:hypothetical protein